MRLRSGLGTGFFAAATLALGGCSTVCSPLGVCPSDPLPEPAPRAADDTCGASVVEPAVFREADAQMRSFVERVSGAASVRWIEPGMPVTKDLRPDRLNMDLDLNNNIVRAYCG